MGSWGSLECPSEELNLGAVLLNGQSFRWEREAGEEEAFVGVMAHRVWRLRRLDHQTVQYQVLARFSRDPSLSSAQGELLLPTKPKQRKGAKAKRSRKGSAAKTEVIEECKPEPPTTVSEELHPEAEKKACLLKKETDEAALRDYFQLDVVKVGPLYAEWAKAEGWASLMGGAEGAGLVGLRQLRQDPLECLFSFIASSNNHISRIGAMVGRLCAEFGEAGEAEGRAFHDFPLLSSFSAETVAVERRLRELGFGYRAAYVARTAAQLEGLGGAGWLEGLRRRPYEEALPALTAFPGVGRKVADCVALMSLDKADVVPVDVHVAKLSRVLFPDLPQAKTLSPALHGRVAALWRSRFGPFAGWAQTVLFSRSLQASKANSPSKAKSKPSTDASSPGKAPVKVEELSPVKVRPKALTSRTRKRNADKVG